MGVIGYPFKIGNVFSITSNTATSPTTASDTAYYKAFYYYFYNLQVRSAGCASANRVAVALTTPIIAQNGAALSSNFTTGNQWYLEGAAIIGATGQTYTPGKSGNYTVRVTSGTGCVSVSTSLLFVVTTANTGNDSDIGLASFPVPASKQLNVIFAVKVGGTVGVSLIGAAGTLVYNNTGIQPAGNFNTVINVSSYAPGTYLLKIVVGGKTYTRKVLILR